MSNFNYEKLSEIGILIGNKKNEDFRLEIIKIELTNWNFNDWKLKD